MSERLSHVDESGAARMVDVGEKPVTRREATARVTVVMRPETVQLIADNKAAKGDVLGVARIAGIMAAKRTSDLLPLCHTLPLNAVDVTFDLGPDRVDITATARTDAKTGVEMEAMTAASIAALTVYDMCKAVDRGMTINGLRLTFKSGGRSGTFRAE